MRLYLGRASSVQPQLCWREHEDAVAIQTECEMMRNVRNVPLAKQACFKFAKRGAAKLPLDALNRIRVEPLKDALQHRGVARQSTCEPRVHDVLATKKKLNVASPNTGTVDRHPLDVHRNMFSCLDTSLP